MSQGHGSTDAPGARPLKTLHVITDLRLGGAERMLAKLARRLPALGIEMEVVSLGGRGDLAAEIEAAGAPVATLGLDGLAGLPAAMLRLRRMIRAARPDMVQTWMYHADLVGLLANAGPGRRPIAWNLRCSDIELEPRTEKVRRVLARLSRHPDLVLANARSGLAAHERLGYRPRRSAVIPNGFDVEEFRPDPAARAALRASLGVGDGDLLIGMAARVAPMKDHETFLRAAAALAARRPDAVFALAGAGAEPGSTLARRAAELGLADRVRMLGPRRDMARLWSAVDVATLSSSCGEGFPNVLGEAMACGAPCVATDVGDVADILGGTGLVVLPRDPDALAEGWNAMAELGPEGRERRGAAGRERIVESFTLDAIAARYAELYRDLAALGR